MDAFSLLEKHLTDAELKEIAIDEWRKMCRDAFDGRAENVIANIGHKVARAIVDECLGADAAEKIAEKAVSVIDDLTTFTIFRPADVWDKKPSPAWLILQDAVRDNKAGISERIRYHVDNMTADDALQIIHSATMTLELGQADARRAAGKA
ncbi:hypothetical protein [Breoghania sp.]|uniref:hypothetical protein n=1 Tax=Breoghania sp. TaxID=2065378 RepID=UPI002AA66CFD|nr:hypothetical protein [Breoghania sp.]